MGNYSKALEILNGLFKEKYEPMSKWRRNHPIKQRGKWKQRPNNPEVFLKYNKKYLTK